MKLLYTGGEFFCTKTEFLNFKITLPLARLDMVGLRLVLKSLTLTDDILVDIQLATFFIVIQC